MNTLHLDLETRSTLDLKQVGVHRYAAHPDTAVWCVAYALGDRPIQVWLPGAPCPEEIAAQVAGGGMIMAHNAQFEQTLWHGVLAPRHGWPEPDPQKWRCTMAMALAMALPAGLGEAAAAVGLEHDKDLKGRRLMLQMCRPRRVEANGQVVWWDSPEHLARLSAYCQQDVEVERALAKRLLPLRRQEQELWWLDQEINRRGARIDLEMVRAAQQVVDAALTGLDREMREVTGGEVAACSHAGQLTAWLRSQGLAADSVAKAALPEFLEGELPAAVRRAIELRQEAARSSTAKLRAMVAVAGADQRARGLFQYHAASTGRWGGRLIQVQNLPRGELDPEEIQEALGLIRTGDVDFLEMMYGPPMAVVASCLRGMIQASPGRELLAADFSAIEARVVAWLAGEERVLEVFRGDGKIYEHAAADIYGVPVREVSKEQRFIGKISILALGYAGGVRAFQAMARNYGVEISEEKAEAIKTAWRKANPRIVRFWRDLEEAALEAVRRPGRMVSAGKHVVFRVVGSFLWCRLPSGRALCYPYPKIIEKTMPWGGSKALLSFKGVDTLGKKWTEQTTYGGKVAENCTQAVARDLLAEAMLRVERAGFPVVMHIHDELVCEVTAGTGDLAAFESLMSVSPAWAAGLPIQAEGWTGRRYRK